MDLELRTVRGATLNRAPGFSMTVEDCERRHGGHRDASAAPMESFLMTG